MKSNPADIDSCSARAQELIDNPLWWNGPEFLWNSCEDWDSVNDNPSIPPDDPEVKKVAARATQIQEPKLSSVLEHLTYFPSWYQLKKAIAVCLWLQQKFQKTAGQSQVKEENVKEQNKGITSYKPVNVKALQCTELQIIKMAQSEAFREEIRLLRDVWWPRAAIGILLYFQLFSVIWMVSVISFCLFYFVLFILLYFYFISFRFQNNLKWKWKEIRTFCVKWN